MPVDLPLLNPTMPLLVLLPEEDSGSKSGREPATTHTVVLGNMQQAESDMYLESFACCHCSLPEGCMLQC